MRHSKIAAIALTAALALTGAAFAQITGSEFTPVGQGILVSPIPNVEVLFDDVLVEGFTSAEATTLPVGDRTTPCGNIIAADFDPPAGDPSFVVYRIETTALIANTALVSVFHPDSNSSLIYAPCEPPEVNPFLDLTAEQVPGDPRARVPRFSEFVVVTDLRPADVVANLKIDLLKSLLRTGSYAEKVIDKDTLDLLRGVAIRATTAVEECRVGEAVDDLDFFKVAVRHYAPNPIPNVAANGSVNLAGNLIAVAATLRFSTVQKCTPQDDELPVPAPIPTREERGGPGRLPIRK